MKCPVCNTEADGLNCKNCDRSIVDLVFKLVEEEQKNRNYTKALQRLYKLRKEVTDELILEDIDRLAKGIEIMSIERDIPDADTGNETSAGRKKKSKLKILLFLLILVLSFAVGDYYIRAFVEEKYNEKIQEYTQKQKQFDEIKKIEDKKALKEIPKTIFRDALDAVISNKDDIYSKDVNNDNKEEVVVVSFKNYYLFEKNNGKLLYWYDLNNGVKYVGGEFEAGNKKGKIDEYELFNSAKPFDFYKINSNYQKIDNSKIEFVYNDIKKEITFTEKGFDISYIIPKEIESLELKLFVEPDYYNLVENEKSTLESSITADKIVVVNSSTKLGIEIGYTMAIDKMVEDETMGKIIIIKMAAPNTKISIRKIE